jgi:hypothetical protein
VCSRGFPIPRECADGLWFDVRYRWCNFPDEVVCDDRTIINPDNPGNRTTVAPPVTQQPPDISACSMHSDLFDGLTYLKSMCIIGTSTNYEAARARCEAINMNLFIIDSSIVQTQFFETTTFLLRNQPGGFVWINGMRNVAINQWNIFNADGTQRGPLFDGVDWVSTDTIDGRNTGECLRYSQQHGPYQAMGMQCNANSWSICEHGLQTTEPTTTPATEPTPTTPALTTTTEDPGVIPPNLAACWATRDLFQGENYLKSMCVINTSMNQAAAHTACRNNGMELFILSDFPVQAAFREASIEVFVQQPRGAVWINGRIDGACDKWHVFDPNPREMFNGVHFLQTDEFHGATMGPCLQFSAEPAPEWSGVGRPCTNNNWFICEYDRANVAEA